MFVKMGASLRRKYDQYYIKFSSFLGRKNFILALISKFRNVKQNSLFEPFKQKKISYSKPGLGTP